MSEAVDRPKVPKLRFPEFEGEWHEEGLGKVFPKIRNGFVGTATPFYKVSGIPYLQGKNIKSGQIDPTGLIEVSEAFHGKQKKSQLANGDLLMVQSGRVGECAVVDSRFDGENCHALIVMTPLSDVSPLFFKEYFYSPSGKRQIHKVKTGNTVEHILTSEMKPMMVRAPKYSEQQKVAEFQEIVYERFRLLLRRREALEAYKKGMMQRLFSKELHAIGTRFQIWAKLSDINGGTPFLQSPHTWPYVVVE